MESKVLDVLDDRVLELGPEARCDEPLPAFQADPRRRWRRLAAVRPRGRQRQHAVVRGDGRVRQDPGRAGKPAPGRARHPLGEDRPASSPAPTSTSSAARPIRSAVESDIGRAHAVIDRLEALRVPSVAVIHGFCLGGGLEVALACQMRIAIDGARFGFPEVMLGLHPGLGGTARFTRLVNPLQAMTLMLTGRTIDARRAKALGLVDAITQERHVKNAVKDAVFGRLKRAQPGLLNTHPQLRPRARLPCFAHAARGSEERAG